jgi:hypothetical protein
MTKTINPALRQILDERKSKHEQLKSYIAMLAEDQTQPLTVAEFTKLVKNELGVAYDPSTIRLTLNELVNEGLAVVRTELDSERSLRARDKAIPGNNASLYFSTAGGAKTPPARIEVEPVKGAALTGHTKYKKRKAAKIRKRALEREGLKPVTPKIETTLESLLQEVVNARTLALQTELNATKAELAELKGALAKIAFKF